MLPVAKNDDGALSSIKFWLIFLRAKNQHCGAFFGKLFNKLTSKNTKI